MRIDIRHNIDSFKLEKLCDSHGIQDFFNVFDEYTEFLKEQALNYQELYISNTYLLIERESGNVVAYMSLIADSIRLSDDEKSNCSGIEKLPFCVIPAMKIAKLAVDCEYKKEFSYIGTLMIELACAIALDCNNAHISCRLVTVDADIEHDENVKLFYDKCGFMINEKYINPKRKTISMRKDLFL